MSDVTNRDRAFFASVAVAAYRQQSYSADEPTTRAQDLIGDLIHFIRLEDGISFDDAVKRAHSAIEMARTEAEEDGD